MAATTILKTYYRIYVTFQRYYVRCSGFLYRFGRYFYVYIELGVGECD